MIQKKLQDVYRGCAEWVSNDDLFFVDSTHTLGPAGEGSRIILDVLPNLPPGAYVYFHDIWFPYDYDPSILDGALCFWPETVLLYAFLCMNQRLPPRPSRQLRRKIQR